MAKHSKRHNIRHKKAITDAKKSKIYAKVGKIIEIAARKGTDPSMNPSLQLALAKARYNGLPREVIDKAVKKGAGQNGAEQFEEISYEGYGPSGSAVLVKALTSNRNRTSASVRLYFSKY
jgi:transcriptional/translational regulatory protein YebC/TACO1